jgi:hypothetical protein
MIYEKADNAGGNAPRRGRFNYRLFKDLIWRYRAGLNNPDAPNAIDKERFMAEWHFNQGTEGLR